MVEEEWKEDELLEYLELSNEDYSKNEWKTIKKIFDLKSDDAIVRIPEGTKLQIFDYE